MGGPLAAFARTLLGGGAGSLVLASASPRRAALLRALGLDPVIDPPAIADTPALDEPAESQATRLAREKARAVAPRHPSCLVIGADTIVATVDGILGKPRDRADAVRMLTSLSGRVHTVVTGVAVARGDRLVVGSETTRVEFRAMRRDEIEAYVDTGEPMDKAGAYGAQALGSAFIRRIDGCYFNVVGLPIVRLILLIRRVEGTRDD
jgi:septum formation protein